MDYVCVCRKGHLFLADSWIDTTHTPPHLSRLTNQTSVPAPLRHLVFEAERTGCPCKERNFNVWPQRAFWDESGACHFTVRLEEVAVHGKEGSRRRLLTFPPDVLHVLFVSGRIRPVHTARA